MAHGKKEWLQRLAERSDLCSFVTHLTKSAKDGEKQLSSTQVLFKILREQKLRGSSSASGFIIGDRTAVCFFDAPLPAIVQNVWFEMKEHERDKTRPIRYVPTGLLFEKDLVYCKGARPVIYERKERGKQLLPREEWWRIVNFDLEKTNFVIDWSHEREWRHPGDLEFALSDVVVLLRDYRAYHAFLDLCAEYEERDILGDIQGIMIAEVLLY
jgi:hypothetical protein